MILNATKYGNTTRTIVGAINFVYNNDVVLLCDTSLAPVTLDLLQIPIDFFSTQYKLYIVDKNNNASVNNITIKAQVGNTVNNALTAVINVNGGVGVVTVSSNTTYNAQFNYGGGAGGNPIIVKDEGVVLTPTVASFDFVGIYVNATTVGNDVTVNINPNFTIVTYVQLTTLITTNALIPSQQYLITDAIFTNTVPIETVAITVEAITVNEISLQGNGIFLNADYQLVGDYSTVVGYSGNLGVWLSTLIVSIGNVVIWNNLHWVNITGANGGEPDLTPADWTLLSKSSTNGYITEIDNINYNVATNQIIFREDLRYNRVQNNINTYLIGLEAFLYFQWGNNNVTGNVVDIESYFEIINNIGYVNNNTVSIYSSVTWTRDLVNEGYFNGNKITNLSQLDVINMGQIINNDFFYVTNLIILTQAVNCIIKENIFKYGTNCSIKCNSSELIAPIIYSNTFYGDTVSAYEIINTGTFYQNSILYCNLNIRDNSGTLNNNNFEYSTINITGDNKGTLNGNNILNSTLNLAKQDGTFSFNTLIEGSNLTNAQNSVGGLITKNNLSSTSTINVNLNQNAIEANILTANSLIAPVTGNYDSISNNNFTTSTFNFTNNTSKIENNIFNNLIFSCGDSINNSITDNNWVSTNVAILNTINFSILSTIAYDGDLTIDTLTQNIIGGIYQNNAGTIIYSLDLSDPVIFDSGTNTLTIPLGLRDFIGEYWLYNGATFNVDFIQNLNSKYATKFINKDLINDVNFKTQPIGTAVLNELITKFAIATGIKIYARINGEDSIYIRRLGDLNGVEQVYQYL